MKQNKTPKCELCGSVEDLRDTSKHHVFCWGCANILVEKKLIVEDCDNLLYDYTDDRLNIFLNEKNEN